VAESYVLDTHPLIFYATDQRKQLGRKARAAFDAFERGEGFFYVPAPVVLETALLLRKGVIAVPTTLAAWWADLEATGTIIHEPLTRDDVLDGYALQWGHEDPFDRSIVAIARRLERPLLTRDGAITEWAEATGGVEVAW
jgi:PIN domain nuclease of toxin-antitoxin system